MASRLSILMGILVTISTISWASPPLRPVPFQSELHDFSFDPQLLGFTTDDNNAQNGLLTIDLAKQTLHLFITFKSDLMCESSICLNSGKILDVELPIDEMKTDACGIRTFFASQDMRSRGGAYQSLSVTDEEESQCPKMQLSPTQVTYEVIDQDVHMTSTISGKELGIVDIERKDMSGN